jgi:SWIM zinc finger
MVVTIDTTNPRSIAGLRLMLGAKGWAKCRLRDGQRYYGVPSRSRPGLIHLADMHSCSCEDFQRRGVECAHVVAVQLHVAQAKAKAALEAKRRTRHTPDQVAAGSALYAELYSEEG